jgi:hypothetical protein
MLQEFLNNNFIQITEDPNLDKLKKACVDITKKISKDKQKISAYALVALDPGVSADNLIIIEVRDIIISHWNTFVTNSQDTPVTYIRAVMLEALEVASEDINNATLIWLSVRNVFKYFSLGREKEILEKFVLGLGIRMEEAAVEKWSLPTEAKLDKLSVQIKELSGIKIDKATLQKKLEDASGPTGVAGTANYDSPNPHWPNTGTPWSHQFAPRAAQAIADMVNKALKDQGTDINGNQSAIQEAVNKVLVQTQTEILQKNSLLQMRTQVLWWKESCYSPILKKSYRGLENGVLEPMLALDYASFVPFIYPVSADFFLMETHNNLCSQKDAKIKISEILNVLKGIDAELKMGFLESNVPIGRISLANFIQAFIWKKCNADQFLDLVGISDQTKISKSEFTLWLFHDLQSLKILITK